ncbi:MAG: glycosyltransferase family 2 protein, partial [Candidatus Nanoarchaeia archaeon]|nr:glycosyltransferase family 2 protein [Candidatus Nanoarchaeia archaeon]
KLKKENLDLCKITRIERTESLLRIIQSMIYNLLVKLLFGVDSKDMNGCPKIFKKEAYEKLNPESKDWFLDAEIMIKLKKNNLKFGEISVVSKDREGGKSSVSLLTGFEFLKNIFKYRFI